MKGVVPVGTERMPGTKTVGGIGRILDDDDLMGGMSTQCMACLELGSPL